MNLLPLVQRLFWEKGGRTTLCLVLNPLRVARVNGTGPMEPLPSTEPVAITLVNKTDRETTIHWHGLELESFNDGVAGWSGDSRQTTRPIPPGES